MSWDVSEWLLETRNQLTTWSDVYWYIWGTINHLECSRCLETFPCTEFSNCRYHPEPAVFEPNRLSGEHPCCGLRVQRFDPLQPNKVQCLPFNSCLFRMSSHGRIMVDHLCTCCFMLKAVVQMTPESFCFTGWLLKVQFISVQFSLKIWNLVVLRPRQSR